MKDIFNLDVLFGFLVGFAVCLTVMLLPWMQRDGIGNYQELASGVLALIGAAAAVVVVNRQIKQTQQIEDVRRAAEDERRERRHYAARVMMPHALNAIWLYAQASGDELRKVLGENRPPKDDQHILLPDAFTLPDIRGLYIEPLQKAVEFGEKKLQERIAELLNIIQINESVMKNMSHTNREITGGTYYQMICNVVEIIAIANDLYPYFRGVANIPDHPGADKMRHAADWCGFTGERWKPLYAFIESRWKPRFLLRMPQGGISCAPSTA